MPFLPSFPEQATQKDLFERWPELTRPLLMLAQQLLHDGPIAKVDAELIFTFVSGVNDCQYAWNIHRHTCEHLGLDARVFDTLLSDMEATDIDARMKVLLIYLRKLTESPSQMTQGDADAVLAAGWSEEQFHYAISICAFTNYLNRHLDGHGIRGNPAHWKKSGRLLAEKAYRDLMPE